MAKVLIIFALFSIFVFFILSYWDKSSENKKKKLKIFLASLFLFGIVLITYLLNA